MRVASGILRDRVDRAAQPRANSPAPTAPPLAPAVRAAPAASAPRPQTQRAAGFSARNVQSEAIRKGRGARRFGEAIWGPLAHAGNVLWLEITGLFFALFAIFFGQSIYRVRGAWKQGPEHAHFLLYIVLTALFAWFSASSFARARHKGRKRR